MNIDYHISLEEYNEKVEPFFKGDELLFKELYGKVYQNGNATKRMDTIAKFGYDVKFAYHIVRLLNEVEQILTEHDLDLERNREQLKSIRRGDWTLDEIELYFQKKELELETLYTISNLRHSPDEEKIKSLLLECLEMHYGNLDTCIVQEDKAISALRSIQEILDKTLRK